MLIGKEFLTSQNKRKVINPYDNKQTGEVSIASVDDYNKSAGYLTDVFDKYKSTPVYIKQELLSKVTAKLTEQKQELADLITSETGKPIKLALIEVDRAILTFRLGAEECSRIHGEVLDLSLLKGSENKSGIVRRFPIGMILGITPWNFPVNLVAHKAAPALASGNVIMIKPSSNSMMSALKLGAVVLEAAMEIGLDYTPLNVVTLPGSAMDEIIADARIKMISFTGSSDIGWGIRAKVIKPRVSLELGGNAGVIVTEDADVASAAAKIVMGGFSAAGQSCISVQRVYVHESIYDAMRAKLIEEAAKIKYGNPWEADTICGPMITEDEAKRAESWIAHAEKAGAKILTGGKRTGAVIEPTIIESAPDTENVKCNEVFAPVITLDKYTYFEEAIRHLNESRFGLQAGVFTNDMRKINYAYNTLHTGGVIINEASAYRMDSMPYGGVKDSGNAREGVSYAIKEMTEEKILVY